MLQNIKPCKRKETKWEKIWREIHHRHRDVPKMEFGSIFLKYEPIDRAYTPDTDKDFTGVYFNLGAMVSPYDYISWLTKSWSDGRSVFYGLCDNASQAIEFYREQQSYGLKGNHIILLNLLDDFRWHKWGPYIGEFTPRHEYFRDEEGIDFVFAFEIYKVV